jgi:hypothetical protein
MSRRLLAFMTAVLAGLSLLTAGPAAQAGSEEDPEIADGCNDGYVNSGDEALVGPPAAMNVLAAWFEGVWEPGETPGEHSLTAVVATLQVCGNLDLVPPTKPPEIAYGFGWDNGDCRQGIRLNRSGEAATRVDARQTCAPSPTELVTLPDSEYRIEGDRLIVTLRVDGPASEVMDGLGEGVTLGAPTAGSWFVINGDGSGAGTSTVEGDTTGVGRDFVIGQDKPE